VTVCHQLVKGFWKHHLAAVLRAKWREHKACARCPVGCEQVVDLTQELRVLGMLLHRNDVLRIEVDVSWAMRSPNFSRGRRFFKERKNLLRRSEVRKRASPSSCAFRSARTGSS
jgi:hypothetical protein